MKYIFIFAIVGLMFTSQAIADVTGPVCVINGDTISVNGTRFGADCKDGTIVRLHGIDAPELDQLCRSSDGAIFKCGLYAASFLLDHVGDQILVCHGNSRYVDGNWLMRCYIDDENINAYMVREGWALSYEMLSRRYQPEEAIAIKQNKGIWDFEFTEPWDWRKGKRLSGMAQ